MFKHLLTTAVLGLLTTTAHAGDIANSLKTSHCAEFAAEFDENGKGEVFVVRLAPLYNPALPADRFSVVLANESGIPVLNKKGVFWAYSPPIELRDGKGRQTYEIFARYGAWMVILKPIGKIMPDTKLVADIFIHSPDVAGFPNAPKCYRMTPFGILGADLPPLDYQTE